MAQRSRKTRYLACVSNRGYRASLVVRRIYKSQPDAEAAKHGLVRVVDESGEGYLYPERMFVTIEAPDSIARAFRKVG